MKNMKKVCRILMAMAIMCLAMSLTACGSEKNYKVTVKDAFGNTFGDGMIVEFLQNGEKVAMQTCDENGVAEKTLEKGDYTIKIMSTDSEASFHYDESLMLTASNTEIDVILSHAVSSETEELYVGADQFDAYHVSEGCTYVEIASSGMTYFLFTPSAEGTYEFSVIGEENVAIGYYGSPHYVQSVSVAEVVDNKFTVSVSESMIGEGEGGTSVYVIGLESLDGSESCTLGINRAGEAEKVWGEEAWTVYERTAELSPYQLPAGAQIEEFDLTAPTDSYLVVYNEEDGFYHLDNANGPLILVRLTEDCGYIDCFQTMIDRSGVGKYFVEGDELIKKESYTECLIEYFDYVDEKEGVYPLTEDLKYIIQQRGEYAGWWDIDGNGYIFKDMQGNNDPSINSEIAWLLMCCYIQ